MNAFRSRRRRSVREGTFAFALVLAAAVGLASAPVMAASAIPAGTNVFGLLSTTLDTAKVNIGDGFSLQVIRPYPDDDASYAGAYVRGHVANVVRAGQNRKPELDLAFDSIVLPSGASAPLTGHVVKLVQKQKSAVGQQAAGAGVGMIVGNILGKSVFHTGLGGLAGAAGGFAYANNLRTNFTVPEGSTVTLQVDQEVPRPQARR
ncbi:MAG: hypothetical protein WAJ85_14075 [Candidatus Baltobacteraceae bacterium]|jgi:hypothetical protein